MSVLIHPFLVLLVLFNLSGITPQLCNQTVGVNTTQLSPSPFRGSISLNPGTPGCSSTPLVCSINGQNNLLFDGNIGPEQPNFDDIDVRFMFLASSSERPASSSYILFEMSDSSQTISSIDLYLMYNPAQDIGIPNFRLYATDSLATVDPTNLAGMELKYDILNNELLSINDTARVKVTLHLSTPFSSPAVLLFWNFQNLFKVKIFLLSEIRFCGDTQPVFSYDIVEFKHPMMDIVVKPSAEVLANGSLLLNCTVSLEGSFTWRWRKGQFTLNIDAKNSIQTTDATRTSVLIIKQLNFMDASVYSCDATYTNLISYATRRYDVQFPTFIEGPPLIDGFLGEGSVTLTCEMYGYATTSDPITWNSTNGGDFTDTSKFSVVVGEGLNLLIYSNGDTGESVVSMLTIIDLGEEDEGNYTCSVEGSQSTTQLTINVGTSPPTTEGPAISTTTTTTITSDTATVDTNIGGGADQTGVIVAAVVVSLVVIAIIVSIIIIIIVLFLHPRKSSTSSRRNSSVNDSSEMERQLTVTKADIQWQIPHEQNGGVVVANGRGVSALYASVDKDKPPLVPSQNFLETDFNDPSMNVYAEACSPKKTTHSETTKDDLWSCDDYTNPNDPQMNIYAEAGSPKVKTLEVTSSDPQLNVYAEAGDPTFDSNNLYAEAKPQRRMTNSSTPKLTKLKKTAATDLLDQNPIYESTGNIPTTESDTQALVDRDSSTVVYAQPSIKRKNSETRNKSVETSEPVYSEALTPALFKEPANATDTSLQPYGPVYALPIIVKKSQDTVKKIDPAHFQEQRLIGVGQFGEVALAKTINLSHHDLNLPPFDDDKSFSIKVAIKKLRSDADSSLRESFEKEIKFMSKLKDANILCLQAISSDNNPFIVMEYMENGDLHQFLEDYDSMVMNHSPELGQISISVLVYMAMQVSSGMKYLASHNYVHRDLATRNCLVGDDYIVKIADFGMSRNLYAESYYKVRGRAMLPIRWMATESFFGRFSEKTDVWSFGVVMWEIFTLCKNPPYEELDDQEIIQNAIGGEGRILLDKPVGCPLSVYDVMRRCWEQRIQERAGFVEVFNSLSAIHRSM